MRVCSRDRGWVEEFCLPVLCGAAARASTRRHHPGGFALIELALWATVLLPVVLAAASLFGQVYDSAVVRMVPEALLRETEGRVVTWRSDGIEGALAVDTSRLGRLVGGLVERGLRELSRESCALKSISALACWWAVSIDPNTGAGLGVTASGCSSQGPLTESLSLQGALQSRLTEPLGVPAVAGQYSRIRLLVGVAVGGAFRGLIPSAGETVLVGDSIGGIREEVSL